MEKKLIWGAELAHSALSRKKGGADHVFPDAIHCAPAGHTPRSVSVPIILRSGPATAEALRRLRSRGSHMDLADGLEMGSHNFNLHCPDLALSQGESLHCSSSPLSESVLIGSSFLSGGNLYCLLFLFRVARVLPRQCVHYGHSQFIILIFHIRPCLPVWVFDCI